MAGHLIFGCSSRGAKLEHFLEQRIPIDDWFYHIIVKSVEETGTFNDM
jgi:MinD-like ATPase involved in chromosome partitioning or flagellar assembly